ncbi:hypothetical protein PPACK8108_LOCUS24841 [Phakopsora pachyrhizi]|uniref:Uncharacterized protein n=1 Tax=Phakopsora pachyrhizi TaxID=170000 RepID=A0AAV0BVS5_PHAPC|nr:hypothetical protein PPACK8108_LOCUS24841 [Phakopsora pachyrhizi]
MNFENFDPYSKSLRIANIKDFMYKLDPHVYIPRNVKQDDLQEMARKFIQDTATTSHVNTVSKTSHQSKGCASLRLKSSEPSKTVLKGNTKIPPCSSNQPPAPLSKSLFSNEGKKRSLASSIDPGSKENPKRSRHYSLKTTITKEQKLLAAPPPKKTAENLEKGMSEDENDETEVESIEFWLYEETDNSDVDYDVSGECDEVQHLPPTTGNSSNTPNTRFALKDIHHSSQSSVVKSTKSNRQDHVRKNQQNWNL